MPPKRLLDSEEDTEEEEELDTTSASDGSEEFSQNTTGTAHPDTILANDPNDEKYPVEDARPVKTPPNHNSRRPPHLQETSPPPADGAGSPPAGQLPPDAHVLRNNPNDEVVHVASAHNIPTPRAHPADDPRGVVLHNAPHDEAIALSSNNTPVGTPNARAGGNVPRGLPTRLSPKSGGEESSQDEDEEDENAPEGRARGFVSQRPDAIEQEPIATVIPNLEYKPQDYAKVNAAASPEMQELFKHILDYQPVIPELPARLRPFVPDYIPSVGDLDPFCKVSRPDGRPDGLGIYVLDEPSVTQSNPAVVLLELRATNIHSSGGLTEVVDSFEDAANRPEVIDRWIADVKKVHYKKPLPTINYQKPMPEIESLMQAWPPEFEDFLNSDIQFPPPHIDLDLDQYVRTLCCVLDIPTYNSLVDSLHVMFTLYQEFRANQHFQHE